MTELTTEDSIILSSCNCTESAAAEREQQSTIKQATRWLKLHSKRTKSLAFVALFMKLSRQSSSLFMQHVFGWTSQYENCYFQTQLENTVEFTFFKKGFKGSTERMLREFLLAITQPLYFQIQR